MVLAQDDMYVPVANQKRRASAVRNGIIVSKQSPGAVECHACMEYVVPLNGTRTVARHQDPSVRGFEVCVPENKCPYCGERNLRPQ